MKFTHSLLLALPILLATVRSSPDYPYCESNNKRGCECAKQKFTCDPFRPNACGSIYMSPDEPDNKVNVPLEVAKDTFQATAAIFAAAEGDPFALFALPFKLVNNGKNPDNVYDVDQDFVDAMKLNVQNYVAQAVSQAEMESLYNGIIGNTAAFQTIALSYANFVLAADTTKEEHTYKEELLNQSKSLIRAQTLYMINQYQSYESMTPMTDPLTNYPSNTSTGANGWGIYYSVFVDQLLIAFLQDIAVTGTDHLAVSIRSQQQIVEYGWKGMKHANELIDTYVAQRESDITGPTSQDDTHYHFNNYEVKDNWAYYQGISDTPQTCTWDELNPYMSSSWSLSGNLYSSSCDQPTVDFVTTSSIHCKEGRRQFVTGSIINSWNTWLIEPAKQWAKLVDLICESGDTGNKILQRLCKNQGKDNDSYKNNGGKAIDYINKKEEVIDEPSYVLGPENTNDCPAGSSHVIERNHCHDAYNQLAKTIVGIKDGVDYPGHWGTTRPRGCFFYLFGNIVNFNPDTNNVSGTGGDPLGHDRPICYSYPKQNGYIIQQKCQKNYPGGNVIATPVPCEVNGCNDYYKSMQPDRNRTMSFYDQCNAGLDGWTCCLDSSSYLSGDSLASLSPKKTSKKSKK